jgi:cleavage and polyadenylation specificity factor subunit 1
MEQDYRARCVWRVLNLMIRLTLSRDVPYSPSFVLDLAASVDEHIRNLVDFVFLPGFNNPTIAALFQPQQTWTG